MTEQQQIKLFQEKYKIAASNPTAHELGESVAELLKENNALEWWDKKHNRTKFTKKQQEIIHAVKSGWRFYSAYGKIWYWVNDVCDGPGPWRRKTPNLRIVSTRMMNVLMTCGQFPEDYEFYDPVSH